MNSTLPLNFKKKIRWFSRSILTGSILIGVLFFYFGIATKLLFTYPHATQHETYVGKIEKGPMAYQLTYYSCFTTSDDMFDVQKWYEKIGWDVYPSELKEGGFFGREGNGDKLLGLYIYRQVNAFMNRNRTVQVCEANHFVYQRWWDFDRKPDWR